MSIATMPLAWILLEISLNFFDVGFFICLGTRPYNRKKWLTNKRLLFIWLGLAILINFFQFLTHFSLISLYIYPLVIFIYTTFGHKNSKLVGFLYGLTLYSLIDIISYFTGAIVIHTNNIAFEALITVSEYRLQLIIICKSLQLLIWLYFAIVTAKAKTDIAILKIYLPITTYTSVALIFFLLIDTTIFNKYSFHSFFLIFALFAIMAPLIFKLIHRMQINAAEKQAQYEADLTKLQEDSDIQCFAVLDRANGAITDCLQLSALLKRDTGTITTSFLNMADKTDQADINAKLQQAHTVVTDFLRLRFQTQHNLIDNFLSIKAYQLAHFNIDLTVTGTISANCSAYAEDLTVLIFYLLRNAEIELKELHYHNKETIAFSFNNRAHGLEIKLTYQADNNTSEMAMPFQLELNDIITKYNGTLTTLKEAHTCQLTVLIPLRNIDDSLFNAYYEALLKRNTNRKRNGGDY